MTDTTETADGQNRQFLTTLAALGIATHRLDQIRDAARLHQQQLIGTSELYAVIEADAPASAVVPAADRAAVYREVAAECDKAGGAYGQRGANDAAGAAFALMETFLRKADEAEYVAAPCSVGGCEPGGEPCSTHERLMAHAEGDHELCAPDCGGAVDRVAAETEAQPPLHRWRVETRDGLADQWAPGSPYPSRQQAVERYEGLNQHHPTWRDGTPVERRITRETTTFTVEEPGPAVEAQPGKDTETREADDTPQPTTERVKHSGPNTKFCVGCLSGEHERVDEQPATETPQPKEA
jgi:hypothetical protein